MKFIMRLLFQGKYEDACAYRDKRCKVTPPVYAERRLFEEPVPILTLADIIEEKPAIVEELQIRPDHNEELQHLLNDMGEDDEDDDIQIVDPPEAFPMPILCTVENFMKHENDAISANLPYNETVSEGRNIFECFGFFLMFFSYRRKRRTEFTSLEIHTFAFLLMSSTNLLRGLLHRTI